ncbi:MAG: hypothetical protein V3V08_12855 [Nannocystaceae bacterium]
MLQPATLEHLGTSHIVRSDRTMARIIALVGTVEIGARRPRFAALVRTIVGQQVSTKAASSIYGKLRRAAGGYVTATRLDALGIEGLRAAGISRQKARYLSDLADQVTRGDLRLDHMHKLPDAEVIDELTRVHGIGEWSAQMFLMFVLQRPDILPVGDLGIQNGFVKVYGLRQRPDAGRMMALGESWRPYRTVGSLYLWRALDNAPA